ncbi:Heavy metal translocating P-type ATPase, related [Neospora caninum Liverpool]|uniref:Heavy metal translocating P-type ATPase, related n=1 Tax=Neospora caninum (strain Liverpool) TaxID=572307 RepID=F0VFP2_NEOCL|nr:Heavy metal translocating P-type ATPase, related [Neospora caninum Liverpool]CBZ52536.1 Heavy metal translocating P-type ATPase, related [Neospora caninum Liverpool]|eukprot:XP_003882568.1 Heavy metal translocating P-type ATPase, related [Neospora caninum Liverpool]
MDEPAIGEPSEAAYVPLSSASTSQHPRTDVWEFQVGGMRCGNCARKIENRLRQTFTSSILSVDVDVRGGRVKVSATRSPGASDTAGVVTHAEIAGAIAVLGLDVSLLSSGSPVAASCVASVDFSASTSLATTVETGKQAERGAEENRGNPEASLKEQLRYAELRVEGMTCASCARHIEKHVQKLPGVLSVAVNLILESATVEYRASCHASSPTVTVEDIRRHVEDLGYRTSVGLDRPLYTSSAASVFPKRASPSGDGGGAAGSATESTGEKTRRASSSALLAPCTPPAATLHLCLLPPFPSRALESCSPQADLPTFSSSSRGASRASSSLLNPNTQPLLQSASTQAEPRPTPPLPARPFARARAVPQAHARPSSSAADASGPRCSAAPSESVAAFVSWLEKQQGIIAVASASDAGAAERARRRSQVFFSLLRSATSRGEDDAALSRGPSAYPPSLASSALCAPHETRWERRDFQLGLPGIRVTYSPDQIGAREILERAREAGWSVEWDSTGKKKFGDLQQAAHAENALGKQFVCALLPSIVVFAVMMIIPMDAFPEWMNLRVLPGISARLLVVLLLTTAVMYGPGWRFHRAAYEAARRGMTDMNVLVSLATNIAFLYSLVAVIFTIYVSVTVPPGGRLAASTGSLALSSHGTPFRSPSSASLTSPPLRSSPLASFSLSPGAVVDPAGPAYSSSAVEIVTRGAGLGEPRKQLLDAVQELSLSEESVEQEWNFKFSILPSHARRFSPLPRFLAAVSTAFPDATTDHPEAGRDVSGRRGADGQRSDSRLLTRDEVHVNSFSGRAPGHSVDASNLQMPPSLSLRVVHSQSPASSFARPPPSTRALGSDASEFSDVPSSSSAASHASAEPADPPTFFDLSAVLICVLLLGKLLEVKAKRRAVAALDELSAAQPEFALLVRNQSSSSVTSGRCVIRRCENTPSAGGAKLQSGESHSGAAEETDADPSEFVGVRPSEKASGNRADSDNDRPVRTEKRYKGDAGQEEARRRPHRPRTENFEELIPVELLQLGDVVRVPPGATVPADGEKINEEESLLSEALLTGESVPVSKQKGDSVLGGSLVVGGHTGAPSLHRSAPAGPSADFGADRTTREGRVGASLLLVRVQKLGTASVLGQIFRLVKDAQGTKTKTQQFIDNVAGYFVPGVLLISAVTTVVWLILLFGGFVTPSFRDVDADTLNAFPVASRILFALQFGIGVLSIACPCALGLAAPTALMVGTGVAARLGILVKSGQAFELATKLKALVLDKTGTLTTGKFEVQEVVLLGSSFARLAALAKSSDWRDVLSPAALAPHVCAPNSSSSSPLAPCADVRVALAQAAESPSASHSVSAWGLSVRDLSSPGRPGGLARSHLSLGPTESEAAKGDTRGHGPCLSPSLPEKAGRLEKAINPTASPNTSSAPAQGCSVSSFREMVSAFVWILGVAERHSEHPVAASLMEFVLAWKDLAPLASPSLFKALPGRGLSCRIGKHLAVEVISLTSAETSRAPRRSFEFPAVCASAAFGSSDGAGSSSPSSPVSSGCCSKSERRDAREERTEAREEGEPRGAGEAWAEDQQRGGATVALLVVNQVCLGALALRDAVKLESREAVSLLESHFGLDVWMCTGDSLHTAMAIADAVGLPRSRVVAEALPSAKVAFIEKLQRPDETQTYRPVGMAGDGLNDAPALAHADLSMAIGAGADLALTAADVVILKSRIADLVTFLELSRAVLFTIRLSVVWACIFNAAGIPLAAGVLYKFRVFVPPTVAGAMMALSSVLVISNALLLRRFRPSLLPRLSSSSSLVCGSLSAFWSSLSCSFSSAFFQGSVDRRGRRVYAADARPPRESSLRAASSDSGATEPERTANCPENRTRVGLAAEVASPRAQDFTLPLVSRQCTDA